MGYEPAQVSKILITHKHPDHTGALNHFPNAKIYASREECKADELKLENVVPVDFTDDAYKNFDKSQKIADGVYYIFAPGHTTGTAIVIVEDGDLNYLIHGDIRRWDMKISKIKKSLTWIKCLNRCPSVKLFQRKLRVNTFAQSAVTFTIPPNMTALILKTFPPIGNARVASSLKINSTALKR